MTLRGIRNLAALCALALAMPSQASGGTQHVHLLDSEEEQNAGDACAAQLKEDDVIVPAAFLSDGAEEAVLANLERDIASGVALAEAEAQARTAAPPTQLRRRMPSRRAAQAMESFERMAVPAGSMIPGAHGRRSGRMGVAISEFLFKHAGQIRNPELERDLTSLKKSSVDLTQTPLARRYGALIYEMMQESEALARLDVSDEAQLMERDIDAATDPSILVPTSVKDVVIERQPWYRFIFRRRAPRIPYTNIRAFLQQLSQVPVRYRLRSLQRSMKGIPFLVHDEAIAILRLFPANEMAPAVRMLMAEDRQTLTSSDMYTVPQLARMVRDSRDASAAFFTEYKSKNLLFKLGEAAESDPALAEDARFLMRFAQSLPGDPVKERAAHKPPWASASAPRSPTAVHPQLEWMFSHAESDLTDRVRKFLSSQKTITLAEADVILDLLPTGSGWGWDRKPDAEIFSAMERLGLTDELKTARDKRLSVDIDVVYQTLLKVEGGDRAWAERALRRAYAIMEKSDQWENERSTARFRSDLKELMHHTLERFRQ